MPLTPFQAYVWEHRNDDPYRLALSAQKQLLALAATPESDTSAAFLAAQVKALQKIRTKIPAWYCPGLTFPLAVSIEQASSERTARFKAGLLSGQKIADLSGGLGVDSFFFAQRFDSLVYVEENEVLVAAARHNFAHLGVQNVQIEHGSAEYFLSQTKENFDLIYLDPARRDGQGGRVFRLEDCSPDVLKIKPLLLQKATRVLLKTAPMLDLRLAVKQLGQVSKIWVVASEGECREVLYLIEQTAPPLEQIPINAVSLHAPNRTDTLRNERTDLDAPIESDVREFGFTWAEEQEAHPELSEPRQFLYEPNPAILKAGAFRCFANRFGLAKLHPNTHLYTASEHVAPVPARSFSIERVCKYDRKAVQAAIPEGKANIACRNFPDTPEQVRRKLGLADGGETYLFAVTDVLGNRSVLVCRSVGTTHTS